jgi:hypothetical protein
MTANGGRSNSHYRQGMERGPEYTERLGPAPKDDCRRFIDAAVASALKEAEALLKQELSEKGERRGVVVVHDPPPEVKRVIVYDPPPDVELTD